MRSTTARKNIQGLRFTLAFGAGFIGAIAGVCFVLAPQIISLFRKESEVVALGGEALRIQCVALVLLPISVVATMLFQSIGKSTPALILSCLQSGLIFIPLCAILPNFIGVLGIEIAQPIAYIASAFVSLPLMLIFFKRLPKDENDNEVAYDIQEKEL